MDFNEEEEFEFNQEEWDSLVLSDLVSVVTEAKDKKDVKKTHRKTNWSSFYRYIRTQVKDKYFKFLPRDLRKLVPKDSDWYPMFINSNIDKFKFKFYICVFDFSDHDDIYDAIQFWTGIKDRAYVASQSSKFYNDLKGKDSKFCYTKNSNRTPKAIIFINRKSFNQDQFVKELEKALGWIEDNQENEGK